MYKQASISLMQVSQHVGVNGKKWKTCLGQNMLKFGKTTVTTQLFYFFYHFFHHTSHYVHLFESLNQ